MFIHTTSRFQPETPIPNPPLDDSPNRVYMLSNHDLLDGGAHKNPFTSSTSLRFLRKRRYLLTLTSCLDELGLWLGERLKGEGRGVVERR